MSTHIRESLCALCSRSGRQDTGHQPLDQLPDKLLLSFAKKSIPHQLMEIGKLKTRTKQKSGDFLGRNLRLDTSQLFFFINICRQQLLDFLWPSANRSLGNLTHFFAVLRQQPRISQKRGTHGNEFSEVIRSSQGNRLEIGLNIRGTRKVRLEGSKQGRQVLRNNCKKHLFLMLEMPVERALRKPGFPRDLFRCHPR